MIWTVIDTDVLVSGLLSPAGNGSILLMHAFIAVYHKLVMDLTTLSPLSRRAAAPCYSSKSSAERWVPPTDELGRRALIGVQLVSAGA